jgi:hypothetical protein
MLKEVDFLRLHQTHLVNIKYIKEFIKSDGGCLILIYKSNIPISVRKRNEVLAVLNPYLKRIIQKNPSLMRRILFLGGRRDSNPRHSVPQTDTLTN